jgi:hypothetical protein
MDKGVYSYGQEARALSAVLLTSEKSIVGAVTRLLICANKKSTQERSVKFF